MNLGLDQRHVLMTGGSKGLGLAAARGFLEVGARVTLVARTAETLAQAQAGLGHAPSQLGWIAADLRDPAAAQKAVSEAEARLGEISVLVNSAGAARRTAAEDLTAEVWREGLEAKFFPYIHTQDAVLRLWRGRQTDGQNIVNIVGSGGRFPSENHLPGGASNAALLLTSIGLARAHARYGIRINAVNPGLTETGRIEQALAFEMQSHGISRDEAYTRTAAAMPLGRFGKPEDVADAVVFLASARASYITGALLQIDGGQNLAL